MRRDACAFSRFARTAANFAGDRERPPRRPILDKYLVTSEGTDSTYRKPLSSSSHTLLPEIFAPYSLPIRWFRGEGERRITQRALILSSLANSGAVTNELTLSRESRNVAFHRILRLVLDMQSSFLYLTYKAALRYTVVNEKDWS